MANAISESLVVFRGAAPQATRREILLGSRDQLGSLLLYQLPCCIVTSLSELLESFAGSIQDVGYNL